MVGLLKESLSSHLLWHVVNGMFLQYRQLITDASCYDMNGGLSSIRFYLSLVYTFYY